MSKFPNEIDGDAELPGVIDGSTELSAEAINAQKAAILAVERTIGTDAQGSQSTIADRLDVSLNTDGTIKSAALAAAGLATLPLSNSDVGASAAIEESKLDLDFSTQSLQNQITSNDVDIYALQVSHTSLTGSLTTHIAGTTGNHAAADITVSPVVLGASDAQAGLQAVATAIATHEASVSAHAASAITYTAPQGTDLDFDNVEEALDGLLTSSVDIVREHSRTAHQNGISVDGYVTNEQFVGGNLASTLYTPFGGNRIIKIGSPNFPSLRSEGIAPFLLSASAANIDIEYWDGYSVQITSITGLNSSPYPVGAENRLRGIVAAINTQLSADRAPVFAFEDGGELTLQHGMDDGYLRVTAPVSSAVSALGFSNVVDEWTQIESYASVVTDGVLRTKYASFQDDTGTLSVSSSTISVAASTSVGALVYISDHPTSSGVYQILALSGTDATLNATLSAGNYRYRIYPDTVSVGSVSAGKVYDIFVDSDMATSVQLRATTTTAQISNLVMTRCDLSVGSYSIALTGSGSNRYLRISDGTSFGPIATFLNGWLGPIIVFGPNNSGSCTLEPRSATISVPATDQFTVHYSEFASSLQRIASFWSNGSTTEYPADLRNFDLTKTRLIESRAVSGFAVSFNATTVTIDGGNALVLGKSIKTQPTTFDFSLLTGDYNMWLDASGVLRVATSASPNTFSHIVQRGEVPVCNVVASSGVTAAYDCALFSTDLSNFSISSVYPASARALDGGLLLADALDVGMVKILSPETAAQAVSVSQLNIVADTQSMQFSSTCELINCVITAEEIVGSGTLTLSGGARIYCEQMLATSISMDSAYLVSDSIVFSGTLSVTGDSSYITGWKTRSALSMAAAIGISAATNILFDSVDFLFPASSTPFVLFAGTNSDISVSECTFDTTTSISVSDAGSTALYSAFKNEGTLSGFSVVGCTISNRAATIKNSGTLSKCFVDNLEMSSSGGLFRNDSGSSATDIVVSKIRATNQTGTFLFSQGTLDGLLVDDVEIDSEFPASTTFKMTDITGTAEKIRLSNIKIVDLATASNLFVTSVPLSIDTALLDTVAAGYIFAGTTTYIEASNVTGLALNSKLLSGESLWLNDSRLVFSAMTGSPISSAGSWTDYRIVLNRCDLDMPIGTTLSMKEFFVSDSQISAGAFLFTASTADTGYRLISSDFISKDTTAVTAFDFSGLSNGTGGTPALATISECGFTGSPTTYLVSVAAGSATGAVWSFANNDLNFQTPASGQAIMRVGDAETSNAYFVTNNRLAVGGASIARAFLVNDKNVILDANKIRATNITSYIFGTSASATQSGLRFVRNHVFGTNVAATTNMLLGTGILDQNTGIIETYGISCFAATEQSGTWTVSGDQLTNSVAGVIYIPIAVPAGTLTEVSVDMYAAGAVSAVTCQLYEQSDSVASPVSKGSASNSTGSSIQTVTISPSSLYVQLRRTLFLRITANTTGNIFGNIRAKVQL